MKLFLFLATWAQIYQAVPPDINWMIYFNTEYLVSQFEPSFVESMLREKDPRVNKCEGMLMTPDRHYFICDGILNFQEHLNGESVYSADKDIFKQLPGNTPLLFGYNYRPFDGRKTFLYVGTEGKATVVTTYKPDLEDIHFLSIVGVDLTDISHRGKRWIISLDYDLKEHLLLGSRNANLCTGYFNHGMSMWAKFKRPLLESLDERVTLKQRELQDFVNDYFGKYSTHSHLMSMVPRGLPVGNVAPYGLIAPSLNPARQQEIRDRLKHMDSAGMFPYSTGYIPTLADTCLVLEGFREFSPEPFLPYQCPSGGFLPQLCDKPIPDRIVHWCQEDYAFTAWASALLEERGYPNDAAHDYLLRNFRHRSSLFIANPLFINYLTARGLHTKKMPGEMRMELIRDTLRYLNSDYSFGDFDFVLSTVFALRTLQECGYYGKQYLQGIVYLLRHASPEKCGASFPFYSAENTGRKPDIILYKDDGIITAALVEQFLGQIPFESIYSGTDRIEVKRRSRRTRDDYLTDMIRQFIRSSPSPKNRKGNNHHPGSENTHGIGPVS